IQDGTTVPFPLNDDGTVDTELAEIDGIATFNVGGEYVFPNLRSGPGRTPITVIDNETAGVVSIESGVGTLVVKYGDDLQTIPGPTDDYNLRLTKRPEAENDPYHLQSPIRVEVGILTDGLADVQSVNGVPVLYNQAPDTLANPALTRIGEYVPSRMFLGNLTFGIEGGSSRLTLTRANGSEMGSFIDEGFAIGQLIQVDGA